MTKRARHLYEFGPFRMDTLECLLLRDGHVVPLTPKLFEILQVLVENSGHLLEKDEFIKQVWPDAFVEEGSLTRSISALRTALGDRENGHQYIETVPRRGYRFVVQVQKDIDDGTELIVPEQAIAPIVIEQEADARTPGKYAEAEQGIGQTPLTLGRRVNLSGEIETARETSSAEYVIDLIKNHKRVAALGLFTLVISVTAIVYFTRGSEAIDSVAVLPLVNVKADPKLEYLSEGISDSIISNLSQLPTLKVIALSSVLRYKDQQSDPQVVGRDLSVRSVLMGRLVEQGDKITVSVELVDSRDSRRLWSGNYDLKLADVQTVQTEIAREISEKLQPRLSGEDKQRLTKPYSANSEAYQLYILGRYYHHREGREGWLKSIEYSEEAIKTDPNFAPAYVELSICYSDLGLSGSIPSKEARQRAESAALKAVEIDDTLGTAHAVLGYVKQGNWDWSGADKEYNRALQLDPNSRELHQIYGAYLLDVGRADEAIAFQKRAQERDPLGQNRHGLLGFDYLGARQYDRAIEEFSKAVERNPNGARPHLFLGEVYLYQQRYDEGIAELRKGIVANAPEEWSGVPMLAVAYAKSGKRAEALKILNEQQELAKQRYISPFNFAVIYTGLGDKDRAFEWLEKSYEEHSQPLEHLKMRPLFDSLRSDPRYTALLRKMNLPQ